MGRPMSGWDNFFIAQVGASAALAGLVFVGVSINLTKIVAAPRLVDYALEALAVLLEVLVVSSLLLVPGQSPSLVGGEVLIVGLGVWLLVSVRQGHNVRAMERQYRRAYLASIALGQVATLPFPLVGLTLIARGAGGLYWIVPGVVFSFLNAFYLAWVLLIEINR